MSEDTIRAVEVYEGDFQEKVVLESPYEARHILKHLPWQEYEAEVNEYGSLREKAEARGTNTKTSELFQVFEAYEKYGFSDKFSTHIGWDPDALGGNGAWTIDANSFAEAADFLQFAGYTVEVADDVDL